jgi:hypothetical protein
VRKSCASLLDGVYGAKIISIVVQDTIYANLSPETKFIEHSLSACASMLKSLPVTSIGGSVDEQIPSRLPRGKASVWGLPPFKQYQGKFSTGPFSQDDVNQYDWALRNPHIGSWIRQDAMSTLAATVGAITVADDKLDIPKFVLVRVYQRL